MDAAKHYWSIIKNDIEYQMLQFELDPGQGAGDPEISTMLQQIANIQTTYHEGIFGQEFVVHNLSGIELGFHIISLILLTFELILMVALAPYQFSFIQAATISFMTNGMVSFLSAIAYLASGQMTEDECLDEMLGTLPSAGECIWKAIQAGPLWEKIALIGLAIASGILLVAELLGDILSAGAVTAVRIGISVILILLFIYDFVYDLLDDDYVIG